MVIYSWFTNKRWWLSWISVSTTQRPAGRLASTGSRQASRSHSRSEDTNSWAHEGVPNQTMKPHLMFFYLLTGKDAESHQLYFRPQNQWSSSGPHQFAPRYYVESLCDPALGINECLAPSGCLQGGATPIARTYGVHIYIYIHIYI